jgi:GT2 family glycosyltransferase
MSNGGISVLTLVKQRHQHLHRLIDGLARSDIQPDELIIVAMDDTPIRISETRFPTRIVPHRSAGLPLAQARNMAAAAARCPLLLFLDVDCIPMRGMIGAMAHHLDRYDGLIGAEVHYLPAGAVVLPWDEARLSDCAVTHPAREFPRHGVSKAPQPGLFWSLAFGVRRNLFSSLGGFDERFTGYGAEDTDLAFRSSRAGVEILFAGGPGVFHQHHANFDPPLQHFDDIIRNAVQFYDIWGVWPMEGWLDRFAGLGLIERTPTSLVLRRPPTTTEIIKAKRPDHVVF